jgi:hypothetical protein
MNKCDICGEFRESELLKNLRINRITPDRYSKRKQFETVCFHCKPFEFPHKQHNKIIDNNTLEK